MGAGLGTTCGCGVDVSKAGAWRTICSFQAAGLEAGGVVYHNSQAVYESVNVTIPEDTNSFG